MKTKKTPAPYILVSMDVMQRHCEAAIPEAERLLKEADERRTIKPYENCLAFALALKALCVEYGWQPLDFIDFIAQIENPPNE